MDFDTLIYVFFIAASIIFSIYRNVKKSQQKRETPKKSISEILEGNIFSEIDSTTSIDSQESEEITHFVEEEFIEDEEVGVDSQTYETLEDPVNYETLETPEEPVKEAVSLSSQHRKTTIVKEDSTDGAYDYIDPWQEDEDSESTFEFEPIKAIIYSEILKRPEY